MGAKVVFFTGAGGFIGRYILKHYIAEPDCELLLLERGVFLERLRDWLDKNVADPARRARIHLLNGDITQPNLGLDEATAKDIQARMTRAIHLAAIYDLSTPRDIAMRVNVDGTRNVLDFLEAAPHLERFAYMSTVAVSGTYRGLFKEEDLDLGQGFKNHYDETKFLAEKLVRERMGKIPTLILRPTIVVGNSRTGEFEKIDGPYFALQMIARNMHLAVNDSGATKCHIAPVDFVADALYTLTEDPASAGKTFCLGDPNPAGYREFLDMVCVKWGKIKPLLHLPPAMVALMFKIPFFDNIIGVSYDSFKYSYLPVEYSTSNATALLSKHGISCPPLSEYLDVMLQYFKEHHGDAHMRRQPWKDAAR